MLFINIFYCLCLPRLPLGKVLLRMAHAWKPGRLDRQRIVSMIAEDVARATLSNKRQREQNEWHAGVGAEAQGGETAEVGEAGEGKEEEGEADMATSANAAASAAKAARDQGGRGKGGKAVSAKLWLWYGQESVNPQTCVLPSLDPLTGGQLNEEEPLRAEQPQRFSLACKLLGLLRLLVLPNAVGVQSDAFHQKYHSPEISRLFRRHRALLR